MCGRYAYPEEADVIDTFDVEAVLAHLPTCGNVRPTQSVGIVIEDAGAAQRQGRAVRRELRAARWGLIPSWTKVLDKRLLLINARSETVVDKPSFRVPIRRRRALVPASGYYEWLTKADGTKQPYFLAAPDQPVIGFAGLYDWWQLPEGTNLAGAEDGWVCSTAIITRPAADALGHIHDRMPVVVPPALYDAWLDPATTAADQVEAVLQAMPDPVLTPVERQPG